jgi:hypothetical protein
MHQQTLAKYLGRLCRMIGVVRRIGGRKSHPDLHRVLIEWPNGIPRVAAAQHAQMLKISPRIRQIDIP